MLTLKMLIEFSKENVKIQDIVNYANSFKPKEPQDPEPPKNDEEISDYENRMNLYYKEKDNYLKNIEDFNLTVEEFLKIKSGFYEYIPERYRDAFWIDANTDAKDYIDLFAKICRITSVFYECK